ncbi:unnamed protein product [Medioppia subpectinata]|uniref:Gamma-interferon-inducible lysosomal thiol reductase n=1 Tax=Medioppia subpectinata TaxID=1979941 RepID=A0A7R9L0H1_9ACAR|nr:unnamed protein product [Medioppia subpectinata]CAG2113234.1 unnamed protein product [Medioppia subpectinata]
MFSVCIAPVLLAIVGICAAADTPVQLDVYYESLCPDCMQFIKTQLVPNYKKLASIMNVNMVPYGWAKSTKVAKPDGTFDLTFTCQHGPQECIGNEIHNCVLESETIARSLELFGCMYASKDYTKPATAAKECTAKLGFNYTAIDECASGPLGRGLHLRSGERFQALTNPKPNFVVWVVVNGVHTQAIATRAESDLVGLICDTYKGTKPDVCKKVE